MAPSPPNNKREDNQKKLLSSITSATVDGGEISDLKPIEKKALQIRNRDPSLQKIDSWEKGRCGEHAFGSTTYPFTIYIFESFKMFVQVILKL